MENKLDNIIDLLDKINKKLDKLITNEEPKSEEDEVIEFLKNITEELGIKDKVTIRKVEIR